QAQIRVGKAPHTMENTELIAVPYRRAGRFSWLSPILENGSTGFFNKYGSFSILPRKSTIHRRVPPLIGMCFGHGKS
ncbi:MAG TPA: hypothetical protein VMU77_07525, partial [Acidimicrobiales bacterium]|nr:hypothetical protein [Acidimicrobiales bacterium]